MCVRVCPIARLHVYGFLTVRTKLAGERVHSVQSSELQWTGLGMSSHCLGSKCMFSLCHGHVHIRKYIEYTPPPPHPPAPTVVVVVGGFTYILSDLLPEKLLYLHFLYSYAVVNAHLPAVGLKEHV